MLRHRLIVWFLVASLALPAAPGFGQEEEGGMRRIGGLTFVDEVELTIANLVVKAVGVEPQDERAMAHSPSDLLLLLDESAGHGGLAATEHELLTRSLELSGLTASDAMTVAPFACQ